MSVMDEQRIEIAGITLHWKRANPLKEYDKNGMRGVLLFTTDLEEEIKLFDAIDKRDVRVVKLIRFMVDRLQYEYVDMQAVLCWSFRFNVPTVECGFLWPYRKADPDE